MEGEELKRVIEGALFAEGEALSVDRLLALFDEDEQPTREAVRAALQELAADYDGRGVELCEVGSGFRFQVPEASARWVSRLWEERPPKYSRALLETLALIAYRQPITRAEVEDIRGVSVSTNIIRTLQEREWVRVVGHRDVPGKPAMYGTTRHFLDYFNLKGLSDLPTLAELRDIDKINEELDLHLPGETTPGPAAADEGPDGAGPEVAREGETPPADNEVSETATVEAEEGRQATEGGASGDTAAGTAEDAEHPETADPEFAAGDTQEGPAGTSAEAADERAGE